MKADQKEGNQASEKTLYGYILAIKYLTTDVAVWKDFIDRLGLLLDQYSHVVELKRIGFPLKWQEKLIQNGLKNR